MKGERFRKLRRRMKCWKVRIKMVIGRPVCAMFEHKWDYGQLICTYPKALRICKRCHKIEDITPPEHRGKYEWKSAEDLFQERKPE